MLAMWNVHNDVLMLCRWDVAAMTDYHPDYNNACGTCIEIACDETWISDNYDALGHRLQETGVCRDQLQRAAAATVAGSVSANAHAWQGPGFVSMTTMCVQLAASHWLCWQPRSHVPGIKQHAVALPPQSSKTSVACTLQLMTPYLQS